MSREVFNNMGTSSARLHNILDCFMIITVDLWSLWNLEHQQQKSWYPSPNPAWTWVVLRLTLCIPAQTWLLLSLLHIWPDKRKAPTLSSLSSAQRLWVSTAFPQCSECRGHSSFALFLHSATERLHENSFRWSTCVMWLEELLFHPFVLELPGTHKNTCFCIIMKCCALRFYSLCYIVHIAVVLPLLISLISPWKSTTNPPTVHSRISA